MRRVFLLTSIAIALWLAAPAMSLGFSSDELAIANPVGFLGVWTQQETGVNPPLFRWLLAMVGGGLEGIRFGRALSLGCYLGLIVVGSSLARTASSRACAALLFAVCPVLAWTGTASLAYSLWTLLAVLYVRAEAPREQALWASLLGWTQYLGMPFVWVFALLSRDRDRIKAAGIATLSWLPLLYRVATDHRQKTAPRRTLDALQDIFRMGFDPTPQLAWAGIAVIVATAVAVALAPKTLRNAYLAIAVSVLAASVVQNVRPPIGAMLAAFAIPALASTVDLKPAWSRVAALLGLILIARLGISAHTRDRRQQGLPDTVVALAKQLPSEPTRLGVYPSTAVGQLTAAAAGVHRARLADPPEVRGVTLLSQSKEEQVWVFSERLPAELDDCEIVARRRNFYSLRCQSGLGR